MLKVHHANIQTKMQELTQQLEAKLKLELVDIEARVTEAKEKEREIRKEKKRMRQCRKAIEKQIQQLTNKKIKL